MKTVYIGDLHGKLHIAEQVFINYDESWTKVFIGDYIDSFDHDVDREIETLATVLDAAETRSDVIMLLGNHEASYMNPAYACSGWHQDTQEEFDKLQSRLVLTARYYTLIDDVLATHAGVSKIWLDAHNYTAETSTDIASILNHCAISELHEVGYARYGKHECGGPLWCDYYSEFVPIEGVKQVFGHSAHRKSHYGVLKKGSNYNIDALDFTNQVLEHVDDMFVIRTLFED
jgi:hypothetical protein